MPPNNREERSHPFVEWYAALWHCNAISYSGKDILLDDMGAARFGMGVDEDGTPVLGVLVHDRQGLLSLDWQSAGFIRNHKGRDWVALSCKDARITDAGAEDPVPLRLWIPVPVAVLDTWYESKPKTLRLRLMKKAADRPICAGGPPLKELPLTVKDVT